MSDLARSTERGCRTCSLIYRGLATVSQAMLFNDQRVQILITSTEIATTGSYKDIRTSTPWKWHFRTLPGVDPPWPHMKTAPVYASHFKSEQSFDVMRSWIQECDNSHSHHFCHGTDQPLSHRLLFLGDQHTEQTIKLVEMLAQSTGRYIALSHCWGTSSALKTTVSNLETMYENIEAKDLPKTFLDAVHCARMLKIQYIWIDSLCIIQDDTSDWKKESAKMCDYYRNAWLVVVAASAQGDTHGFLGNRPPSFQGIPLQYKEGSGTYDTCTLEDFPHISGDAYSATDLQGDFVRLRAWCLQETALARRVVTFHRAEMTWSCYSATACECGEASRISSAGQPIFAYKPGLADYLENFTPEHHYSCYPGPRFSDPSDRWTYNGKPFTRFTSSQGTYEEWRVMLVPLYTTRLMTYRKDKLPAISGLAALVGAQEQSLYLAGIWSRDIQLGLLWEIEKNSERPAHPNPSAPSFSWASVDQPIMYKAPGYEIVDSANSPLGDIRIELLDSSMDLTSSNEYGAVSGGYVRLSGLVSQVLLIMEDGHFKINTHDMPKNHFWEDESLVQVDTCLRKVDTKGSNGGMISTMRRSTTEIDGPNGYGASVDCLVVADIRTPSRGGLARNTLPTYVNENCEEYVILLLGKMEFADNVWSYQRLGKAVLVFEPGDGPRWLTQAKQQELIIR
jgi:hypothetical protein